MPVRLASTFLPYRYGSQEIGIFSPNFSGSPGSSDSVAPWWKVRSHFCEGGVQNNDLPLRVEFFKIHSGCADHFGSVCVFGIPHSPANNSERQIRFQKRDLDARRIDNSHVGRIPALIFVGTIQVFPSIKLLRINHGKQTWRLPIDGHQTVEVASVPAIEHF